jgi:beta-glucosidase
MPGFSAVQLRRLNVAIIFLLFLPSLLAQPSRPSPAEVEKRVDSILSQMTIDEKINLLGGVNNAFTIALPRLNLPSLKMSDGPAGVHNSGPTTAYPAPIALAASWNTDLAKRVGAMMGEDARARGVHFILAPAMNIYRAPMNGRNFEYLGEDPYLASRMAVNLIEGIQSQNVIATAKHFVANNSEYDRMQLSSDVDERTLREIYLPAFEASVEEAHVGAIMDAYNRVNGVYMTANEYLNNQVLKKEWGFNGILMSDWGATHDGIAAANGGLDLEMPSGLFMNRATILPAIKTGAVTVATIDDKVRRILRKEIEFGFLDRDQTQRTIPLYSQEGRDLALEEAREGMVLLKNDRNILPLDKTKLKTIAVIGPNAYPAVIGGGGSSLTQPFHEVSNLEGISDYLGKSARVLYATDNPDLPAIFTGSHFVTAPNGEEGLTGEYFNNQDLQGSPVLTRIDKQVNFQWGEGSFAPGQPIDHFSARWTGYFIPQKTGDYRFYTNADDGVRLYLDGKQVIEDWNRHVETVNSYGVHLEAGKPYAIKLEYFEAVGAATAEFGVVNVDGAIGTELKDAAQMADVVVLCVGFNANSEAEGSDRSFELPSGQESLIRQISSLNKNTVVVLNSGGAVDMTHWIDGVAAVLHEWYPGQEGGTALAQILFGDYSPSGKLPASFERRWEDNATYNSYYPEQKGGKRVSYKEGIFLGYRHFDRSSVKPLFPFGFGLSYTTFKYTNLKIAPPDAGGSVHISFDVANSGTREGAEVAEVFVGDSHSVVPRPLKELKGFAKVKLKPGEKRTVEVTLDRRSFSYFDVAAKDWKAEPGAFQILVGSSSQNIELKGDLALNAGDVRRLADPYGERAKQ